MGHVRLSVGLSVYDADTETALNGKWLISTSVFIPLFLYSFIPLFLYSFIPLFLYSFFGQQPIFQPRGPYFSLEAHIPALRPESQSQVIHYNKPPRSRITEVRHTSSSH